MAGNYSFELAGTLQGTALDWTVETSTSGYGYGAFDTVMSGLDVVSWDPAEDFEDHWFMPALVHAMPDTVHGVTAPDATAVWAEVYTLLIDCLAQYKAHVRFVGFVHLAADVVNIPAYGDPITSTEAINLANALKDAFNSHIADRWLYHGKTDVQTVITTADADGVATCAALANAIKAALNAHELLTSFGDSNDAWKDEYEVSDLEEMVVADYATSGVVDHEAFEAGWALPDLVSSGKIAAQTDQIRTDGGPLWPIGHVQLLDNFDYVESERMAGYPEDFESGWLLPGSDVEYPNTNFKFEYWDETNQEWRYVDSRNLELFHIGEPPDWYVLDPDKAEWQFATGGYPAETFELDWRHNDIGYGNYYDQDEDEWRFEPSQISLGVTETFESGWTLTWS